MACPVCFGGEDTLMRESLNAGIGVLVGVTAVVLACFATFIVKLARRSQLAEALEPANQSTILNHQSTTIH